MLISQCLFSELRSYKFSESSSAAGRWYADDIFFRGACLQYFLNRFYRVMIIGAARVRNAKSCCHLALFFCHNFLSPCLLYQCCPECHDLPIVIESRQCCVFSQSVLHQSRWPPSVLLSSLTFKNSTSELMQNLWDSMHADGRCCTSSRVFYFSVAFF